jgi:hypothetical protein
MTLRDRVIAELDRIPPEAGALVYDRGMRLLAEREPGSTAVIVVLDLEPDRFPEPGDRCWSGEGGAS